MEIEESANMQAILKLEFYRKTVEALAAQLQRSEAERDKYLEDYNVALARTDKLELENKKILAQLLETGEVEEQLLLVSNELKATQEELLNLKLKLAAAEGLKLSALKQAEEMQFFAEMEREKAEELLKHLSELREAIHLSELAAIKVEKKKSTSLTTKDMDIQFATTAALEAQQLLENTRKQFYAMKDLEEQLSAKSLLIDSLQRELEQAKDAHSSSVKASSDAIDGLNRLKMEIGMLERRDTEGISYVELMKIELEESKEQLRIANEEVSSLNHQIELSVVEMQKMKNEMAAIERSKSEAQVEIAMVKSELHKSRAKIAAAKASEARAKSSTFGLYLAVQQLAIEAEEAKKESLRLKEAAKKVEADAVTETSGFGSPVEFWKGSNTMNSEIPRTGELRADADGRVMDAYPQGFCSGITISREDYEFLIRKVEKADKIAGSLHLLQEDECRRNHELETLKEELESANAEIVKLRSITNKAWKRMELADKAKVVMEDHLRRSRERRQRSRAALTALREELIYKETVDLDESTYDKPSKYEPLGKVLNIKL